MMLARVSVPGKGLTDTFRAQTVACKQTQVLRVAGTVQPIPRSDDRPRCDMDVHILPDGPVPRLSEDRGPYARRSRLDAGVLEAAVAATLDRPDRVVLLVVKKFGKQEDGDLSFVPLIANAMARGQPVLVAVNPINPRAPHAFADGLAQDMATDPGAIATWAIAQCRSRAA